MAEVSVLQGCVANTVVSKLVESVARCRGVVYQTDTFIARACFHCVGIADEIERVNGFHIWAGNLELAV